MPYVEGIERAKRPSCVPVVFTRNEVERLLARLSGTYGLIYTHVLNKGGKGVRSPLDR